MLNFSSNFFCFILLLSSLGLLTAACSAGAPAADIPATPPAQATPATPVQEFAVEAKSVEEPSPTPGLPTEITDPSAPVSPVAPPAEAAQTGGSQGVKPLAGSETALAAAMADLAKQQNLTPDQIILLSMEATEWGDTSLGCPQEGMMYAQVITPGFLMILEAQGQQYTYHTDQKTNVVWCKK
jgi:hypothetical protein